MAIIGTINGGPGPVGLLVAPAGGQQFPALLGLKTDDGTTVAATLEVVTPAGVGAQLTQYGVVAPNTFNTQRKTQLLNDYHALSRMQPVT